MNKKYDNTEKDPLPETEKGIIEKIEKLGRSRIRMQQIFGATPEDESLDLEMKRPKSPINIEDSLKKASVNMSNGVVASATPGKKSPGRGEGLSQ